MQSTLYLALLASSTVLALPAASPAASFVGFSDSFACANGDSVTAATVEAAAAVQEAAEEAAGHVLQIGAQHFCSGILGKRYRADITSCNLRTEFVHNIKTNTYGFCTSKIGIPATAFVSFPELSCASGSSVTSAATQALAATTLASGVKPVSGGRDVECSGVEGVQYLASVDSCDTKIFFTYNFDSDSFGYCNAVVGEPKFVGYPDEFACGASQAPVPAASFEAQSVSTSLADPNSPSAPTSTCSGVTGSSYGIFADNCDSTAVSDFAGIIIVQDPSTNTFGWCGPFSAPVGGK